MKPGRDPQDFFNGLADAKLHPPFHGAGEHADGIDTALPGALNV